MFTTRQTLSPARRALVQFRTGARHALLAAQAAAAAAGHHELAATSVDHDDADWETRTPLVTVVLTCTCGRTATASDRQGEDLAVRRAAERAARSSAARRLALHTA